MPLTLNDKAPDFTAVVQNPTGTEVITLSKILESGQKVLLIFYPGDDTPGCTAQLCGVKDVYADYQKHNVKVFGVNPANEQSHLKFIHKFSYPFGIVVDADKSIRESYGAIGKFFANIVTKRCVFLIDTDSTIIFQHNGQQDNQEIFRLLESV